MKAVAYRLRCVLRAHWRGTLGLSAVVAVVGAVVLTFAAGAQRTGSAPDRYTTARGHVFDGIIQQARGLPRVDELAALDGAKAVESATFVFGGLLRPDAADKEVDGIVFGGSYRAIAGRLTSGRDPNSGSHEFVATKSFVEVNHARIGDRFHFGSFTQEHADRAGFSGDEPDGPSFDDAVLVGVIDGPADYNDPSSRSEPVAVFPSSLLDLPDIGVATSIMSLVLEPGVDLDSFRAEMDTLPDRSSFGLEPAVLVGDSVRTAVDAQSRGLWLLAGVSAVAAIVVLGQLITRQVRLSAAERSRLSAIGFTDGQIVAESVGRAAVPIVVGMLVAVVLATIASGIFPTGFVRRMEPHPGVRFETVVLILGGLGLLVALLLWSILALGAARLRIGPAKPSGVIEGIATKTPSTTAATGLRFAFTRGERDIGSVRTSMSGLLMTVIGIVGALTFASSLERLVTDRARFGYNYDINFGSGQTSVSDDLRASLDGDPDVSGLMLLAESQARVGESGSLQLIGMELIRGADIAPKLLAGRLPASEDEIALGRLAAHELGVTVGDELTVQGDDETRTFRVTGLTVVPSIGSNDGVGQDGIVTLSALHRLNSGIGAESAVIKVRHGAPPGTAQRIATENGAADTGEESPPAVIQNLARVRAIPYLLAAMLSALAVLTVAHVMLTSMHNRRRDIAIVRSLGADSGWITRAVHWQATSFTFLPIVIGTPVGLIIGSIVFRKFADSVGAVNGASLPFLLVVGIVVALVVLANLVAALPARRARRLAPALLLQSE